MRLQSRYTHSLGPGVMLCLLLALGSSVSAARLYKPRDEVIALLGEKESRLYFNTCEMSSKVKACYLAMDSSDSQELSQCALTDTEDKSPWWMGILENPAYIVTISILNMDAFYWSFTDALTDMTVSIMDDVCFKFISNSSFSKRTFTCDQVGDEINIVSNLKGVLMAICEVEVIGIPLKFPSSLGDIKFQEPSTCSMSSGAKDECFTAINNETDVAKSLVAAVGSAPPLEGADKEVAWFEMYLLMPSIIIQVHVYSDKLVVDMAVNVNRRLCTKYPAKPKKPNAFPWKVYCKYFGDNIRVELEGPVGTGTQMRLSEVQALGFEPAIPKTNVYVYLGCYKDSRDDRDLPELVSGTRMTPEKCYKICKRAGTKYFGLQNARLCYCGSSYGKHGKVDEIQCNSPCQGDFRFLCGGVLFSSVCEVV